MSAAVTDYNQMLDDLLALVQANVTDFDRVTVEKLDLNKGLLHRRTCDIELVEAADVVLAGNEYLSNIRIDLVVIAYDLSSYDEAARVRNDLVRTLKLTIRQNQRFSADVNSTVTGRTSFAQEDLERGFLATAVVEITVQAYEGEC